MLENLPNRLDSGIRRTFCFFLGPILTGMFSPHVGTLSSHVGILLLTAKIAIVAEKDLSPS